MSQAKTRILLRLELGEHEGARLDVGRRDVLGRDGRWQGRPSRKEEGERGWRGELLCSRKVEVAEFSEGTFLPTDFLLVASSWIRTRVGDEWLQKECRDTSDWLYFQLYS